MGSLADSQAVTALLARIYKRPPQMVRLFMLPMIAVGGLSCFSFTKLFRNGFSEIFSHKINSSWHSLPTGSF